MPRNLRRSFRCSAALLAIAVPAAGYGQSTGSSQPAAAGLRETLREVFHFGSCPQLICLSLASPGRHGEHFIPATQNEVDVFIGFVSRAIQTSVSNVPLGSTSSGTLFEIGRSGLPVPVAGSSGPIVGERAQTSGRGRLLIGANLTGGSFQSVRGVPLSDLRLTLTHEDVPPAGLGNPTFERDTIGVHTSLRASMTAASFYATYGLTDRIDVGVVVPVVRISIDGTSIGTIVNTSGDILHLWAGTPDNPKLVDTAHSRGSATGIGDMAARFKFNLAQSPRAGAAFLADVRIPTGSRDDLLGTGKMSVRGLLVTSARVGAMTPHANVGFLWRDGVDQNSAMLGVVGFDALAARGLTLAADLTGAYQIGENRLMLPAPVRYIDGSVVRTTTIPNTRDHQLSGAIGAKYVLAGGFVGIANATLPLGDNGMRPNLFWTVGLERQF